MFKFLASLKVRLSDFSYYTSNFLFCFAIAQVAFETCSYSYTNASAPCSKNGACRCLKIAGSPNTGYCGPVDISCSQLVSCNAPSNICYENDHACVNYPLCGDRTVCYPLSKAYLEKCPPLSVKTTTITSGKGSWRTALQLRRNSGFLHNKWSVGNYEYTLYWHILSQKN